MVKTRSRSYCNFIIIKNESLFPHERFINRPSPGDNIVDSIIALGKEIAADNDFNKLIFGLLGEPPLLDRRTYLLTCLENENSDRHSKKEESVCCQANSIYPWHTS